MYYRFSAEARDAMRFANQAAMRFGHEYIAPADILLGIARLESLGRPVPGPLRESIEALRGAVEDVYSENPRAGEERVPHVPRAKRVLEQAIEESRSLGHEHVGSEHILLGVLRAEDPVVSEALARSGVDAMTLREVILRCLGAGSE